MRDIRLIVEGMVLWFPREMVGAAAAASACQRIGLTDSRLRLRRKAGGRFVADADVLRSVLRDGEALDLELPPDVIAAD